MAPEKKPQKFETYEQVANFLLDEFAAELGLERVEGKQKLAGKRTTTIWEIDGKGVKTDQNQGVVVVQSKRYTTKRVPQGDLSSLAYTIIDLGGSGGIVVSPYGFQSGARKIAERENITEVHLDQDSTTTEYVLRFLEKIFVGVSDQVAVTDEATAVLSKGDEQGS